MNHLQDKWNDLDERKRAKFGIAAFSTSLLLLICILYQPFIFGDRLFIFSGPASDSIGQTVPFMLNEASRLSDGDLSQWNQYQFLGSATIQHFNPDYLPAIFGEDAVPGMMLVSQLAKIFLAGIFFYLFLGYYNLRYKTRYVSALGFALCGRMIELAPWTAYTLEVTLLACLLWGFERFFNNRKRILVLPLAFGLIGMSEGLYALVLYAFVIIAYAIFRTLYTPDKSQNRRELTIFGAQFSCLLFAGVLISLPVILPSLEMYSTSSRISSDMGTSNFSFLLLLTPSDPAICSEEVVKFFSNAILGHMDSYSGSANILNSPYFYVGTLPLLGMGFAFNNKTKRQRVALGVLLFACAFYCYSEGFRYLLNGFSVAGSDFRQSSFWVATIIALIGALGLDAMWESVRIKQLAIWTSVLVLTFVVASFSIWDEVSKIYFATTLMLISLYFALFLALSKANNAKSIRIIVSLIVLIAPIEYIAQDCKAIQHSISLTTEEYDSELSSNPAKSIETLTKEETSTQRIDYKTMMLTRSMADTYLGTQAYIGGAGLTQSVTDFIETLDNDYICQLGYSRYSYGFFNLATNSLLGVKYLVYPNDGKPYYIPYGYVKIGADDKYVILKNTKALPLAFTYNKNQTMGLDSYLKNERPNRSLSILNSAILPEGSCETQQNERQAEAQPIAEPTGEVTKEHSLTIDIPSSDKEWLEASMDLAAEASVSGSVTMNINFFDDQKNLVAVVPYYTAAGNEHINVQVENNGIRSVEVEFVTSNACDDAIVRNIQISACGDDYFSEYNAAVETRKSKGATLDSYENGQLNATVNVAEDGYLATTIPWSDKWDLFIDGERVDTFPINIGFVGCDIPKGQHTVELSYDSTIQSVGVFLSIATLLILIGIPRIGSLKNRSEPEKDKE